MKSISNSPLKDKAGRVLEVLTPRNIFWFSVLGVSSILTVKNALKSDSLLTTPATVRREVNVINSPASSLNRVDDMLFGVTIYNEQKRPNLTGGLGVDGQPVHITKTGEYEVQKAGFEEFFSTLWSNKWTAVEIIAGSLIALSLLSPYAKGAKKTVSDQLTKEVGRLKRYILEDTGAFGTTLTTSLEQKAMQSLDAEVRGGALFPEAKDINNAKNYELWKQWRASGGPPTGTHIEEVKYYNTLAPRLETALADKVAVLKQQLLDQMAANLIESLPKGYGPVKKALTDAKSFKLNESVQQALQDALDENNIKIKLDETVGQKVVSSKTSPKFVPSGQLEIKPGSIVPTETTYETTTVGVKPYGEFLNGLSERCSSIKKTMGTFITEKMPVWSAVKADFSSAETSVWKKAGKPLMFIGALLVLGYGISNLDKVYRDYANRVRQAEANKTYQELPNANKAKGQTLEQSQNPATAESWLYGGKDYTRYTPGFFVLQSTAQPVNTVGSRDFRVIYAPKADKTDQMLSFQTVQVGELTIQQLTGMPMVGIDKTKRTFVYGMFQDYPIGGYVADHRYQLTITVNSDANMWGFQIFDLTDKKPLASHYNIPLPATWDLVKAAPDKFRIYDCAHPR